MESDPDDFLDIIEKNYRQHQIQQQQQLDGSSSSSSSEDKEPADAHSQHTNKPAKKNTVSEEPEEPTSGKGNSILHEQIVRGEVTLVSFDVETGGEDCGICQISAVAADESYNSPSWSC